MFSFIELAWICGKNLLNGNKLRIKIIIYFKYNKEKHGVSEDVFFSLPCVLGVGGITNVLSTTLAKPELDKLLQSAKTIDEVQKGIKF